MRQDFAVRWIERAPDLYEARLTTPDGGDVYVGYIAVTPGAAVWRGYVGRRFAASRTWPWRCTRRPPQPPHASLSASTTSSAPAESTPMTGGTAAPIVRWTRISSRPWTKL